MAKPTKLPKKEYSEDQLQEMGEILLKAKDIEADPELLAMVKEAMSGKAKKIRSLDDVKKKAADLQKEEMEEEDEKSEA
jgi:hypothetical protein